MFNKPVYFPVFWIDKSEYYKKHIDLRTTDCADRLVILQMNYLATEATNLSMSLK